MQAPLPPPQNPGLGPEPGVPEPRRDRGTGKASGNLGFMEPDPGPGAEAGTAHMPAPAAGSGHRLRLEWAQAGAGVPTRTQGPAEVPKGSQALWEVEEGAGGGGGGPGVPTTQAGPADISASAERVVICHKKPLCSQFTLLITSSLQWGSSLRRPDGGGSWLSPAGLRPCVPPQAGWEAPRGKGLRAPPAPGSPLHAPRRCALPSNPPQPLLLLGKDPASNALCRR